MPDVQVQDLHRQMGYYCQKAVLFNSSLVQKATLDPFVVFGFSTVRPNVIDIMGRATMLTILAAFMVLCRQPTLEARPVSRQARDAFTGMVRHADRLVVLGRLHRCRLLMHATNLAGSALMTITAEGDGNLL